MRIGIFGSGSMGSKLGTIFVGIENPTPDRQPWHVDSSEGTG
jgi:hypothetical protein